MPAQELVQALEQACMFAQEPEPQAYNSSHQRRDRFRSMAAALELEQLRQLVRQQRAEPPPALQQRAVRLVHLQHAELLLAAPQRAVLLPAVLLEHAPALLLVLVPALQPEPERQQRAEPPPVRLPLPEPELQPEPLLQPELRPALPKLAPELRVRRLPVLLGRAFHSVRFAVFERRLRLLQLVPLQLFRPRLSQPVLGLRQRAVLQPAERHTALRRPVLRRHAELPPAVLPLVLRRSVQQLLSELPSVAPLVLQHSALQPTVQLIFAAL